MSKVVRMSLVMLALTGWASIRAEEAAEPKALEASVALGATVNEGNTDNSMLNFDFGLVHRPGEHQVTRFDVNAAYGETDNEKTTENAKAALDYQYIFTERAYVAFNQSVATDDIADLDYRSITALGLGYYVMKNDAAFLTLEAGPAYVFEEKAGVEDDYAAARVAQRYERTMDSSAKFWESVEYVPQVEDTDVYLLTAEVGVEAPVSEKLNIRLVVKNVYDSEPAEGLDENDLSVIGALAYSLF